MAVPKGAKRELVKVAVQLISLVGAPANLTPFSAVKSAFSGGIIEDVMVYKAAGYVKPTGTVGERILKRIASIGNKRKDEPNDGGADDDAAARISKALNIGAALKEDDPMSKETEKLEAKIAELTAKVDGLTAPADVAEGITDATKASEIASRFAGTVETLEAAITAAKEKDDKSEKAVASLAQMEKILTACRESQAEALKAMPEEFRKGKSKGKGKADKPGEPKGKDDDAEKALNEAVKRLITEHRDASKTGTFDDNAITPDAQALIRQEFGALMKERDEAAAADKTIQALKDQVEKLTEVVEARKSRPGRSALATDPGAGNGSGSPEADDADEAPAQKGWRPNMADGLTDPEDSTKLATVAKSEDGGDWDTGFKAGE